MPTLEIAKEAMAFADRQNAGLWRELASLVLAAESGHLESAIAGIPEHMWCVLSFGAELIVRDLRAINATSTEIVRREAVLRPERWLDALRREARGRDNPSRMHAARLLDEVGDHSDVGLLRTIAREPNQTGGDRQLGKALARKLAHRVDVDDLGRVSVRIGQRRGTGNRNPPEGARPALLPTHTTAVCGNTRRGHGGHVAGHGPVRRSQLAEINPCTTCGGCSSPTTARTRRQATFSRTPMSSGWTRS